MEGTFQTTTQIGNIPGDSQGILGKSSENLQKLGYLAFDSDRIPIRTDKDALLYYLLFASKHPKGNEFWHKIILINPHGQRRLPGISCSLKKEDRISSASLVGRAKIRKLSAS